MKYMLMCYGNQDAWDAVGMGADGTTNWPQEHVEKQFAYMKAITDELAANGELVLAAGLADPTRTRTVRSNNGEPLVTDGPYLEAKEFLAGWWVVDCASFDRVAQIAARVSDAPTPDGPMGARVEVRPVDEVDQ